MQRVSAFILIFAIAVSVSIGLPVVCGAEELFPEYDAIKPNVSFWTKIYTQYPTTRAVVHDSIDVDVVYDIIDIKPYDAPGARKINRKRMKQVNAKYRKMLQRLAANPNIDNPDYQRVKQLFGPEADAETFRRASHRIRSQIGQKDRFVEGLVRSGAYIDQIRDIFKAHDLPEDLAFLPHVESSFNLKAYSKFGAAGIWQFTRSTGKRFMSVGYVLDERRDPISATHAAARLLKENYEKLGSWPLAITAYNHGATGVKRAKQARGDYPSIFKSYRSRTFKFASRNFYSEFLAARKVASDYTAYFGIIRLDPPIRYRTVTLEGYADLQRLSAHFNTAPDELQAINPALRPPVFNGQKFIPKGYRLHLPLEHGTGSALLASIPASLYEAAQKPSRFYTVRRGDTAGKIARMHRVKLADLILANNLNRRATIYPKQTLRIPLPGEPLVAKVEQQRAKPILLVKGETQTEETVFPAGGATKEEAEAALSVVDAVETVSSDSEPEARTVVAFANTSRGKDIKASTGSRTNVSDATESAAESESPDADAVSEPEQEIGLVPPDNSAGKTAAVSDSSPIETPLVTPDSSPETEPLAAAESVPGGETIVQPGSSGQPLRPVPVAVVSTPEPEATPERGSEPAEPEPSPEIVTADVRFEEIIQVENQTVGILRVAVEETLGHYAEWAGVRTQQIRRLNGMAFGGVLSLNQKIKIPLHEITPQTFEENRYEYHKRLQEDFFAVYRVGEVESYRVREGDNIWTLCRQKFEVPVWLLQHYNSGTDLAALHPNQTLMIPEIEKTAAGDPGTVTDEDGDTG